MIGRRRATAILVAVVAALAVALGLGPGAPRPEIEAGARRAIIERATAADDALAALDRALSPAVEAARAGGARVVAGSAAPGSSLTEAADLVADAEDEASAARRAIDTLDRARRAADPGAEPLQAATEAGEIGSIATQLRGTAEAADEFAAMRTRAADVARILDEALAALAAGDLASATALTADARVAHDAVAAWDVDFVTLPVWIETTDEMIGAVERIVDATADGDAEAAQAAAADFAALAEDAATADRALRIAVGEGGSAVTAAPLGRLASVLSAIAELRAAVVDIREEAAA